MSGTDDISDDRTGDPVDSPTFVRPDPESRLAHLAARYDELKARADAARAELDDLTLALKAELSAAAPCTAGRTVVLATPDLRRPLRLSAVESWRIDAKRLKAEDPTTYIRWAVKSTSLKLERVRG